MYALRCAPRRPLCCHDTPVLVFCATSRPHPSFLTSRSPSPEAQFSSPSPFFPVQNQINSRIDLVLRMADEKWRLAQHAYDRLDVNIRRLDADLGRMEVILKKQ